jgi:tetratricopeptide (TPR) repeat protein
MQHFRVALLCIAVLPTCHAQNQQGPTGVDPAKTQPAPTATAPQPPSPDDAPIPDQGAIRVPYNSTSPIKRALRRLDPNCLDAIFHLCWSSPPTDDPIYKSYEKKRVAEDLEAGDAYMKRRNYRGAEFRYEDALQYEPENPEATFKLAESLQNLGRKAEACTQYTNYLNIEPSGAFSDRAKKGLQMLTPCPAVLTVQ